MTSAVRSAQSGEPSGFLRLLDLENQRVLVKARVPESAARALDPNPRGGVRGAKGISSLPDRLVFANSDRIFALDRSWELTADFGHPWLSGVHDLVAEESGLWVTATNADLLVRLSWDGSVVDRWCWRDHAQLVREVGLTSVPPFRSDVDFRIPRTLRAGVDNIGHVNAVSPSSGSVVVSLGRVLPSQIVVRRQRRAIAGRVAGQLGLSWAFRSPTGVLPVSEIPGSTHAVVAVERLENGLLGASASLLLAERPIRVPNHNVWVGDGVLVYNDSNRGELVVYDRGQQRACMRVPIPGSPAFVRGLVAVHPHLFLVGSQRPAAVYAVDLGLGRVVATFDLEGDSRESVYAICVVPDSFSDPPASLRLVHPSASSGTRPAASRRPWLRPRSPR